MIIIRAPSPIKSLFLFSFSVLSTAPEKYYIPDSSGVLKARNRVDILVRHSFPIHRNVGTVDKLRVQITERGKTKVGLFLFIKTPYS